MKTSPQGTALTKFFEECRLEAYPDPATGGAPWTVGWGHTGVDVSKGLVIDQTKADCLLTIDQCHAEYVVSKYIATDKLRQYQFDALVDFVFNVGPGRYNEKDGFAFLKNGQPSTMLRRLQTLDFDGAADEFPKWNKAGGAVMHGLVRRRAANRAMFLGRDWRAAIENL